MEREVGVVEMTRNNEFEHRDVLAVSWSFLGTPLRVMSRGRWSYDELARSSKGASILIYYKHA